MGSWQGNMQLWHLKVWVLGWVAIWQQFCKCAAVNFQARKQSTWQTHIAQVFLIYRDTEWHRKFHSGNGRVGKNPVCLSNSSMGSLERELKKQLCT